MRVETKRTLKRFFRNPSAIIGVSILVFFCLIAVFAPVIAPPVSPMDPTRKIHDPYTMPKITWKQEPIPPTSKSYAEKVLIAKGLEKYWRKASEEDFKNFMINIVEGLKPNELVEIFPKIRKLKKKIKEYLIEHVEILKRAGLTNPENYVNSYLLSDFILMEKKMLELDENFREFLTSLTLEIKNLKKYDLLKIFQDAYVMLDYKYAMKITSKYFGVKENNLYDFLLEKKIVERRPIRCVDYHIFGMIDGRDIFYGVVWGTRTAFRIGLIVTFFATLIGLLIGSIAGYYGGWVDEVLMRITDVFLSIPFLVAAIVLTTFLGTGLDKVMVALVVFGWMGTARLIRGNILQVKEEQFILAAKALGVKDFLIITRHVLPNTIFPVVIQASMRMGSLVITAAALSFLGLGAPTGYADWGALLNYSRDWILGAQGEVLKYWFALTYPGTAMVLFVLAWNLLGDALRDTFDPRLRG